MKKKKTLNNRELSWLSFNERVLQEAEDSNVPLIERVKFLGIFSSNRDEFFRVRIAALKRTLHFPKKAEDDLGHNPKELLHKIQKLVIKQQKRFEATFNNIIIELSQNNIFIVNEKQISEQQGKYIKKYFQEKVMPTLFPIIINNTKDFPFLKDRSGYFIIKLSKKEDGNKNPIVALIEVPTDDLSRFLVLPKEGENNFVILLDDVIRLCLDDLFNNFEHDSIEAYNIKLTRDADLDIDIDYSKSFLEKITRGLKKRKRGQPVRLVYDENIAPDMLSLIVKKIHLRKNDDLIPGGRYHNFKDFMSFPSIGARTLRYPSTPPLKHPDLPTAQSASKDQQSFFKILKEKDVLLTFPYQTFDHIIDFLREASIDPKVQTIQITLYRVAKNSSIVKALINALKNGKKVNAIIELQARFDEKANIFWSNKLKDEGANVIYGVPGLKVHSKLFLISRLESGKIFNYGYIGTGNFNGDTAKVYTDHCLITADKKITNEVDKLFKYYSNNLKKGYFRYLLVSPFYMRNRIVQKINNEILNAKNKVPASIFLKVNNLVDKKIIHKLYEASNAGVKIKLIVRGMCAIIPGVKGQSENIEAISIVDKFLEHTRIFVFLNGGDETYYLSSGDWMSRNLDQRSEVAVPIFDKKIQAQLKSILEILWMDNTKARILDSKQKNEYRPDGQQKKVRSQESIYHFLKNIK